MKVISVIIITGIGCSYDKDSMLNNPGVDCSTVNARFSAVINPILQSSCALGAACHGAGSVNGPGPLTSYIQAKNAAEHIKHAVVSRLMPQGSVLPQSQIQAIACWVDGGAPNN